MKTGFYPYLLAFMAFCVTPFTAGAQGRVVINEYLPWPGNGCNTTSEFVELLNFGPGPVDISCYVLTNGSYSITIPPQTILEPGKFYVIAGQDELAAGCGNIAAPTPVDLNWNNCGCTSSPIPVAGEGLMPDGGNANVHLVLLNPDFDVVDAVTRQLPVSPSPMITTSGLDGSCAGQELDLDDLLIPYETLGMSTGIANSFARKLDGDCGWVKDPQQSAGATNNTPGTTSEITYLFDVVQSMDCDGGGGRVSIYVRHHNYADIFPMNYTLAFDVNSDGRFGFEDEFKYSEDNTPPDVMIDNLPVGDFRVTLASINGCFLQTFAFRILECLPTLPLQLTSFTHNRSTLNDLFEWEVTGSSALQSIYLEKSSNGRQYEAAASFHDNNWQGTTRFSHISKAAGSFARLKLVKKDGAVFYSKILRTGSAATSLQMTIQGGADGTLHYTYNAPGPEKATVTIFNTAGTSLLQSALPITGGDGKGVISINRLPAGIYLVQVKESSGRQLLSKRFVKP